MTTKVFIVSEKGRGMCVPLLHQEHRCVTLQENDIIVVVQKDNHQYVTHHRMGHEPEAILLLLGTIEANADRFLHHGKSKNNNQKK